MSENDRTNLAHLPETDRLRAIEVSAGVEKTSQICRAISVAFVSVCGVTGIGLLAHVLLDAGARAFLAPFGWVFFFLAAPAGLIPVMAQVFRQRANKVTRRTRYLEKRFDPDRTSSLLPGEDEDEL